MSKPVCCWLSHRFTNSILSIADNPFHFRQALPFVIQVSACSRLLPNERVPFSKAVHIHRRSPHCLQRTQSSVSRLVPPSCHIQNSLPSFDGFKCVQGVETDQGCRAMPACHCEGWMVQAYLTSMIVIRCVHMHQSAFRTVFVVSRLDGV